LNFHWVLSGLELSGPKFNVSSRRVVWLCGCDLRIEL